MTLRSQRGKPVNARRKANPNKAAVALNTIRPNGLVKVVAIAADGGAPIVKCFELPAERDLMRDFIKIQDRKRGVYFEPNPPKVKADRRSKESDIAVAEYSFVDCDPKFNGNPEEPSKAQKRHRARLLSGVVPKPTFVYSSGGGTVALWKHAQPVVLSDQDAIDAVKATNIGLARKLGTSADGYDTCQSVEHLYRVPHTTNLPSAKKRAAGRGVSIAGRLEGSSHRSHDFLSLPVADVGPTTPVRIGRPEAVDLDNIQISERSRSIIENGWAEGRHPADDSPSGWRMSLIHGLKQEGHSNEMILSILMNPDNSVSADRAKRAGSQKAAESFFKKEIAKAASMRHSNAAADFDDDICDVSGNVNNISEIKTPAELHFDLSPHVPTDPSTIPTRKWLYGTSYIRKFIGLTAATGGAGKSSLILVECVAMACGKNLLGIEPVDKLKVLYWNGEDPQEELERRVAAILKWYGLTQIDLGDRLFIKSGRDMPIRIAELVNGESKIVVPMVRAMLKAIKACKLDVVAIDPFVSSHGVPENDNNAIELVAKKWADIADKTDCAIVLSHHTRKTNGDSASIEHARGASALNYAARTRRSIGTMTGAEAKAAGFVENDRARLSHFKADMTGSSMMKPTADLDWYRFESVSLMNGPPDELTGRPTEGDSVGVVVKWEYSRRTLVLDNDSVTKAIEALKLNGPWRYNSQAADWAGVAVAEAAGVDLTDRQVKAQTIAQIEQLIIENKLQKYEHHDGKQRKLKVFVRPTVCEDLNDWG